MEKYHVLAVITEYRKDGTQRIYKERMKTRLKGYFASMKYHCEECYRITCDIIITDQGEMTMYTIYILTLYKNKKREKVEYMSTDDISTALKYVKDLQNFTVDNDYLREYVTMDYEPIA